MPMQCSLKPALPTWLPPIMKPSRTVCCRTHAGCTTCMVRLGHDMLQLLLSALHTNATMHGRHCIVTTACLRLPGACSVHVRGTRPLLMATGMPGLLGGLSAAVAGYWAYQPNKALIEHGHHQWSYQLLAIFVTLGAPLACMALALSGGQHPAPENLLLTSAVAMQLEVPCEVELKVSLLQSLRSAVACWRAWRSPRLIHSSRA